MLLTRAWVVRSTDTLTPKNTEKLERCLLKCLLALFATFTGGYFIDIIVDDCVLGDSFNRNENYALFCIYILITIAYIILGMLALCYLRKNFI